MAVSITTLYIRNLNEKVSRNTLQRELNNKFREINMDDKIVNIAVFKNLTLRGQAFVTCSTSKDCDTIMTLLNTEILLDRPMDIYLANANSDASMIESISGDTDMQADPRSKASNERYQKRMERLAKNPNLSKKRIMTLDRDSTKDDSKTAHSEANSTKRAKLVENNEPSNVLLLQGLPGDIQSEEIVGVFEAFTGFVEVNLVAIRRLSFVEFDTETSATSCLNQLGKIIHIKEKDCLLTYAKQ